MSVTRNPEREIKGFLSLDRLGTGERVKMRGNPFARPTETPTVSRGAVPTRATQRPLAIGTVLSVAEKRSRCLSRAVVPESQPSEAASGRCVKYAHDWRIM
jgi:hypothetical protein